MRDTPFLIGKRLVLRPLRETDCAGPYPSWFNDAQVCRHNAHHVFPYTSAQARAYLRRVQASPRELVLAIELKRGRRHIGNLALLEIDLVSRSAELAIVIGEKDCWSRGYATEACRLLLSHAFTSMNLHRVGCGTSQAHVAMQRLARALGMRPEGRRREALFKRNQYHDLVEFGVLKAEYLKRR